MRLVWWVVGPIGVGCLLGASSLKPGLHIVVTIVEHACDHVLKSVLKPLTHRLQIFLVIYEYLPSLRLCEYHGIPGKLKKRVCNNVLAIFTTYMETRLQVVLYGFCVGLLPWEWELGWILDFFLFHGLACLSFREVGLWCRAHVCKPFPLLSHWWVGLLGMFFAVLF